MTIAELKALIADLPDDDRICVAGWFAEDERLYLPHAELGGLRSVYHGSTYHVIGRFDNCAAHQLRRPSSIYHIA